MIEPICWICGQAESRHNENLCSDTYGEHQAQKEAEKREKVVEESQTPEEK